MKKHISKLLFGIICAVISLCMTAHCSEVPRVASTETVNTVKLLEIANGDENGNMNFDNNVTRAEFIKMAITASPNKEKAQNTSFSYSLFPDVKNTFWGAPYISVAIESGLVNGYLDGTFKPGNLVTLEEGATIVLRLLGYNASDFTGTYPSSQIEKYRLLKLDENISAKTGDKLTREECMILLYNALNTNTKSGVKYCTTLGYTANSNGKIDYSALLEKELDGPVIYKNDGKTAFETDFVPDENTLYYLNNSYAKSTDIAQGDVIYYSDVINSVFIYRKTATGIVTNVSSSSSVALYGGKSYEIKTNQAKNKLSLGGEFSEKDCFVTLILGLNDSVIDVTKGDLSKLADNSDNIPYVSMIDATISRPVYLESDDAVANYLSKLPSGFDSADYYINGSKTDVYSAKKLDVLYYSKQFNSVWVYRKSESGTISAIGSSTVTIGNKTYSLATDTAKSKLSTYGEYKTDSYVTVIFGKNDEVIDLFGNSQKSDVNGTTIDESVSLPIYIKDEAAMENWTQNIPFAISEAQFYLNGKEADEPALQIRDVIYYSDSYRGIWIFRDSVSGVIGAVNNGTVTVGNKVYSLATTDAKNKVSNYGSFGKDDYVTLILGKGSEVIDIIEADTDNIGKNDDDSSYKDVVASSLKGPYVVKADKSMENLTIDLETSKIFLKNAVITPADIKPYDVYSFSPVLKTVWIYRDTVSGTIEDIYPISSPTTVVIAGNSYSITTSQASYDLSGFGAYGIGDKATLLLDMNGGVAGVADIGSTATTYYGIITARGTKVFKDSEGMEYSSEYVTVTDCKANAYTYEYSNRSLGIGDVVKVFSGESLKITEQSTAMKRNDLAKVVNAINSGSFHENCNIIEVNGASVKKLYTSRFEGANLTVDSFLYSSVILHYQIDSDGNLTEIIFNNYTGDMYSYGVVTTSSGSTLTYMTDSLKKTFEVKGVGSSVGPVAIYTDGTAVSGFKNLIKYVEEVENITSTQVFDSDGKVYNISENVKVFHYNAGTFKYITLDDALKGNYDYYPFYDRTPDQCGLVRVIIVINAA